MSTDKIYCNELVLTERTTQYGSLISVWIPEPEKLVEFLDRHKRANGQISLTIMRKKEPAQGKPTHYAILDTYEGKPKREEPSYPAANEPSLVRGIIDAREGSQPNL